MPPANSTSSTLPLFSSFLIPFLFLLPLRLLSAFFSPISDCDETFNYYEPTHYLLHSHAFQTWEYSPLYALRSYAYLLPHILPLSLPLPFILTSPKISSFYSLRISLAILCAVAEAFFISATSSTFSNHTSQLLLLFLASSPGMFRASVEFLPSSFAMLCLLPSFSFWFLKKYPPAIFFVAVASLLGWIYAAILAIPIALHILLSKSGPTVFITYSVLSAIIILSVMVPIDTYFFGKLVIAPLNHVLYNVFPKEGTGSALFGVEKFSFYIVNLALNCNVPAVLFAVGPLLIGVCAVVGRRKGGLNGLDLWKRLIYLSPTYFCFAVFAKQPHKEERFLVPCYPFIALVAAVAFADAAQLVIVGIKAVGMGGVKVVRMVKFFMYLGVSVLCVSMGASRMFMQVKAFQAPLQIYHHLSYHELRNGLGPQRAALQFESSQREINICVGKEWYRFPNSFFLPHRRFRLRFVRSGFTGLLPKPYAGESNGTRIIPPGMNEFNREDPAQYYNWEEGEGCHYFVDLDLSHRSAQMQHNFSSESPIPSESREVIASMPFLDSDLSKAGFRAFYIPGFESKLVYGEYQLIRNLDILPYSS